jgi:hypothetical protein
MIDEQQVFERVMRGFVPPDDSLERLERRRDRKRRNQRIAAGVVGIAVFVPAIWIVTSGGVFDRSETSVVPGGDVTGPATETGPAVSGPPTGYTGDPFSVGFDGLPPESATPSEPFRGELVVEGLSCGTCRRPYITNLYADGRLIWAKGVPFSGGCCRFSAWIEQRLTPEGVELLGELWRELPPFERRRNPGEQLPVSAWEDVELRPYVPQRYAILPRSLGMFPAAARDLLRGTEGEVFSYRWQGDEELERFVLTIDETRALAEILGDAGFEGPEFEEGIPGGLVWDSPDGETIQVEPILPHGIVGGLDVTPGH